jgi:hypothetical protein
LFWEKREREYVHLDDLLLVSLDTGALAGDLGGVDQVLEELLVDGGEGAGAGAHLLGTGSAGGLGHDAALGNEDDVAVRELLLELTGESILCWLWFV